MTARHSCKIPRDRSRIRVMRSGLSRERAIHWEKLYIARYGRKDLGTGILVNRTDGGDATIHSRETLEKIRAAAKKPENVARLRTMNIGRTMHAKTKEALIRANTGRKMSDANKAALIACCKGKKKDPAVLAKIKETRERKSAEKYGLEYDDYCTLTAKQRNAMKMWIRLGTGRTGWEWLRRRGERGDLRVA